MQCAWFTRRKGTLCFEQASFQPKAPPRSGITGFADPPDSVYVRQCFTCPNTWYRAETGPVCACTAALPVSPVRQLVSPALPGPCLVAPGQAPCQDAPPCPLPCSSRAGPDRVQSCPGSAGCPVHAPPGLPAPQHGSHSPAAAGLPPAPGLPLVPRLAAAPCLAAWTSRWTAAGAWSGPGGPHMPARRWGARHCQCCAPSCGVQRWWAARGPPLPAEGPWGRLSAGAVQPSWVCRESSTVECVWWTLAAAQTVGGTSPS